MNYSIKDIEKLAKTISHKVTPNYFILLSGELGAGKTTFTKILLKELGVKKVVKSPTFNIMHQYDANGLKINHIDAYRLTKESDVEMFVEQFDNSLNIIEWHENFNFDFSKIKSIEIKIFIIDDETRRVEINE
ncbi:tRNA (adenosine(37)-N6)-threonylcarbamoyltransferase complex ATPase subunit type 1 TsaE [Spiroplasma endosymbiont of Crioceris asparagi]|uniref:tRNA (adenosine(37)-N6)-threonylcarbamoyltransferase complex ATPase subunit type 1 TsaE n=1 Tax=Spiroplasma endosymbiont of Crioceris asparagi TaxID=3066286 RepID=UPI0030D5FA8D